jgi:hypothetical protein
MTPYRLQLSYSGSRGMLGKLSVIFRFHRLVPHGEGGVENRQRVSLY